MGLWAWVKARWPKRKVGPVASVPEGSGSIPETPSAFDTRTRFVVERVAPDGVVYHAYQGMDGSKAIEAWEEYQHDLSKTGVFTFRDRLHPAGHRGRFTRGIT